MMIKMFRLPEGSLRCLSAYLKGTILTDSEGGIWTAGDNIQGQLARPGDGSVFQKVEQVPPIVMTACGYAHILNLDERGGIWTWGYGDYGQLGTGNTYIQSKPCRVPSVKGVIGLVAGRSHSLAFLSDGSLLVFGFNQYGQLGLSHTAHQITPSLSPLQATFSDPLRSRQKSARSY